MLEHKKRVVCKLIKNDIVSCIGECYIEDSSVIYLNIDNDKYINKCEDNNLLLIYYKQFLKYDINGIKFRKIEFADASIDITI